MKTNTELTLTKSEIEEAITEWVSHREWNVKNISFNYGTRLEGFGYDEHEVDYFEGAKLNVERIVEPKR